MDKNISKTYVITDTHFEHAAMQKYCGRPANFGQIIINQWQACVNPQDIVYHLGDVTWGSQGQLSTIMAGLPGTKILIRGNHDKNHSNNWFIQAGFTAVLEKAQLSKVILSHTPALMRQEEIDRGIINLHGHFHNNPVDRWEPHMTERLTDSHYLFIMEDNDYRPISMESIRKRKFIVNSGKLIKGYSANKGIM